MMNPDYIEPELYDRSDVLWIMKKQRVDNARDELRRLELKRLQYPANDYADDLRVRRNALVICLAELHLATIL